MLRWPPNKYRYFLLVVLAWAVLNSIAVFCFVVSMQFAACVEKREAHLQLVGATRVYPRTIDEVTYDYHATTCEHETSRDNELFQVSDTIHNRALLNCRFLREPVERDRERDAARANGDADREEARRFDCSADTFLAVFILSKPTEFETRRIIRETWARPGVDNVYHPNLVNALPEPFRTAFSDPAVRQRFGVRTFFVLGTDERIARKNEQAAAAAAATAAATAATKDFSPNVTAARSKSEDWLSRIDSPPHHPHHPHHLSIADRLRIAASRRDGSDVFRIERGWLPTEAEESATDRALRVESEKYGDILQASFVDSYGNLTMKVLLALKWLTARCASTRYVLKIDTDTVPHLPGLVASLIKRDVLESHGAVFDHASYYFAHANSLRRHFASLLSSDADADADAAAAAAAAQQPKRQGQRPGQRQGQLPEKQPSAEPVGRSRAEEEAAFYMAHHHPFILGYRYRSTTVSRRGRWAVSRDAFPVAAYPKYVAGTGYVLSTTAAHEIYLVSLHYRYFFGIEDAFVTGVVGSLIRATKRHDSRFSPIGTWFQPSICTFVRSAVLTTTNLAPHDLLAIGKAINVRSLQCH